MRQSVRSISSVTLRHWLACALVLLTLCVGLVTVRKTASKPGTMTDFSSVHLGARCLVERCDPYVRADIAAVASKHAEALSAFALLYPPSTLLLASPLVAVGWPAAGILWNGFSVLAMALACFLLVEDFQLERTPATLLPVLALFLGTTLLSVLEMGNPALLTACLLVLGCVLSVPVAGAPGRWRPLAGAVLLGVALAMKPQLAVGPVVVWWLYRPTRAAAAKAVLLAALLFLGGVLAYRARLGSFEFLRHLALLRHELSGDGASSQSALNPAAKKFLGVQAIGITLGWAEPWPGVMAWSLTLLLAAAAYWRRTVARFPWSTLALALLVSLLPVYHRKYDRVVVLLLVPAIAELDSAGRRRLAFLVACGAALWVVYSQVFQYVGARLLKLPLSPMIELAMCGVLLWAMWRDRAVAER